MTELKDLMAQAIFHAIPPRGIHFRGLLRRLRSWGVLGSDKTLKKYLDVLTAQGYLDSEMDGVKRVYLKTERVLRERFLFEAQMEALTVARTVASLLWYNHMDIVERVVLFGSVARADSKPDSDIDLLVIVSGGRTYELLKEFSDITLPILYDLRRNVSLVLYTKDEFERLRRLNSSFIADVIKGGITLYERRE